MAYIKQNFTSGQKLNAAHLNHIEEGIAAIQVPTKISAFENDSGYLTEYSSTAGIPGYVLDEADRVVKLVQSRQSPYTLTFIAASDAHYSKINNAEKFYPSIQHMGQAMKVMKDSVFIDFIALLGDYCWDSSETTEQSLTAIREFNRLIGDASSGILKIRAKGNHDNLNGSGKTSGSVPGYLTNDQVFSNIGIFNRGAVFDSNNPSGGYCYRDFPDLKLRVICLNTSDDDGKDSNGDGIDNDYGGAVITDTQNTWFQSALTSMGSGWGAILLSHHPLDWSGLSTNALTTAKNNASKIYCNLHGHVHCHSMGYLSGTTIPRAAIPNACFQRNNEYGSSGNYNHGVYPENTVYKIQNSAEDTSFSVVTVDTLNKLIYIDNYGAGFDRVISYGTGAVTKYTVTNQLTQIKNENTATTIDATKPYRAVLTPTSGYRIDTLQVIMGTQDITDEVQLSKNIISIPTVTGNITIKATAVSGTEGASNLYLFAESDTSSAIFNNGLGYKNNVRLSSSKGSKEPYYLSATFQDNPDYPWVTTGYIPYSIENGSFPSITIDGARWEGKSDNCRLYFFNSSKNIKTSLLLNDDRLEQYFIVIKESNLRFTLQPKAALNSNSDIKFFRISLMGYGNYLNVYVGTNPEEPDEDHTGEVYPVTYILNNVVAEGNTPETVTYGSIFATWFNPLPGYTILKENVSATMGGTGSIDIDPGQPFMITSWNVTGPITISMTATLRPNLADIAQNAENTYIYNNGLGYRNGACLSSDPPYDKTWDSNTFVTGWIPYNYDTKTGTYPPIYITGAVTWDQATNSGCRIYGFQSKAGPIKAFGDQKSFNTYFTFSNPGTGDMIFYPNNNHLDEDCGVTYLRISMIGDGSNCNVYFEDPIERTYKLTQIAKNATFSTNNSSITANTPVTITATANSGYQFRDEDLFASVGTLEYTNITNNISSATFTFNNVNADVKINAHATPIPTTPSYTNVLSTAQTSPTNTTPLNNRGFMSGSYISTSAPLTQNTGAAHFSTGFIPFPSTPFNKMYIRGTILDNSDNYSRIFTYNSDGVRTNTSACNLNHLLNFSEKSDKYYEATWKNGTPPTSGYLRFCLPDAAEVCVITFDQEINDYSYNIVPKSYDFTDKTTIFNNVGYKNGYYFSTTTKDYKWGDGEELVSTGAINWHTLSDGNSSTGIVPETIYIKGIEFDPLNNDHHRILDVSDANKVQTLEKEKIFECFSVTKLGDKYYSLTPTIDTATNKSIISGTGYFYDCTYIVICGQGCGADLIVHLGVPIE